MRLDILLTKKKLAKSRQSAQDLISSGEVSVDGQIITKPAKDVPETANLQILNQPKYVSRGGLKLEKALVEFHIDPSGLIVLDVGSSTGGFTDCLLQHGASKVYAVDVGTDQLAEKLRSDPRVISLEKTDIRKVGDLPDQPDLAVIDASFISLELILPTVSRLIKPNGSIVALVKPQFETGPEKRGRNGVITEESIRMSVLAKLRSFAERMSLTVLSETESPILGGDGNREYLMLLK